MIAKCSNLTCHMRTICARSHNEDGRSYQYIPQGENCGGLVIESILPADEIMAIRQKTGRHDQKTPSLF